MAQALLALFLVACSSGGAEQRRAAHGGAPLAVRLREADPDAGAVLFRQCAACHSVREGGGDRDGPNLYHVLGRPIGRGSERFGYTAALQRIGGVWTVERLDAWLTDPQQFAPGTSMGFPGLPNGVDRADVIAFLNQYGSDLPLKGEGVAPHR